MYWHMLVYIIRVLTRARTHYTCARAHPRKNAHAQYMTYSSAHGQARMHPGTCGLTTHAHKPPRMNIEHACMHAHAHALRTHSGTLMHALAHAHTCIRTRMREHTSTCARTLPTTYIFACPCPSPKGWYHVSQGESSGCRPAVSAGSWV